MGTFFFLRGGGPYNEDFSNWGLCWGPFLEATICKQRAGVGLLLKGGFGVLGLGVRVWDLGFRVWA